MDILKQIFTSFLHPSNTLKKLPVMLLKVSVGATLFAPTISMRAIAKYLTIIESSVKMNGIKF